MTEPGKEPESLRCSYAAQLRGDPLVGTAAPALGFLLVEQPGPWGRHALTDSRLDPTVGRALSTRAVATGLRVLLIRRPGRDRRVQRHQRRHRRFAVVDSRPGSEGSQWGEFDADSELLDVPLDMPLDGTAGAAASYDPIYLVCTHGRHDTCCAIRGRPVAAALARVRPDQTWECSHVGGDRFAANLIALPHGVYYGRADVGDVVELVTAHERGDVVPGKLRGRSRWLPVAQAAQEHARELYGDLRIDAFAPEGTLPLGDGQWQVRLRYGTGHLVATVQASAHAEPGLLTCHARHAAHPPAFEVTSLFEVSEP